MSNPSAWRGTTVDRWGRRSTPGMPLQAGEAAEYRRDVFVGVFSVVFSGTLFFGGLLAVCWWLWVAL